MHVVACCEPDNFSADLHEGYGDGVPGLMPKRYDWVIHDMTRPDCENPAFGPMTEEQKCKIMANSKKEGGQYEYWAQNLRETSK